MNKLILGVVDTTQDSGVALIDENKIIMAINEERVSRKKLDGGFPRKSLRLLFNYTDIDPASIDEIIIAGNFSPHPLLRIFRFLQRFFSFGNLAHRFKLDNFLQNNTRINMLPKESKFSAILFSLMKSVYKKDLPLEIRKKEIVFIDHHLCHAAGAFFTSNNKKALCITMDCIGDGSSLTVNVCKNKDISKIFELGFSDSIANFYSIITAFLGFKHNRDESKVTCLASYGNSEKIKVPFPFYFSNGSIVNKRGFGTRLNRHLRRLKKFKKKDVAAWLQKNTEDVVCKFVDYWTRKTNLKDIVLAGGFFANIKVNQRIKELKNVKSVYVFPNMGDSGLALGAALAYTKKHYRMNIYSGTSYSDNEIEDVLKKHEMKYKKIEEIEKEVALLLSKGKVVAVFNGRMEFGPRALGNRSILYQPNDSTVVSWLNRKLKRTDFMPFSPTTLKEYSSKCYKDIDGAEFAAKFMTITFDCTDWMKKACSGVVHIDGTSRPQVLSREDNPFFYKIIDEYRKLIGLPTVLNTSFNIHEEPIVCSPEDAVLAFLNSGLDYMAIGKFLIYEKENKSKNGFVRT